MLQATREQRALFDGKEHGTDTAPVARLDSGCSRDPINPGSRLIPGRHLTPAAPSRPAQAVGLGPARRGRPCTGHSSAGAARPPLAGPRTGTSGSGPGGRSRQSPRQPPPHSRRLPCGTSGRRDQRNSEGHRTTASRGERSPFPQGHLPSPR